MALRPPQHRADAPIVFVHPKDPAWDNERIEAELADRRDKNERVDDHPVLQYQGGHTRYDVSLVNGYFKPAEEPTRWTLKRLDLFDFMDVQSLKESEEAQGAEPRRSYMRALVMAFKRVDNGPEIVGDDRSSLSRDDIKRIAALNYWDPDTRETVDVLFDVGRAAYIASMPMTRREKKA